MLDHPSPTPPEPAPASSDSLEQMLLRKMDEAVMGFVAIMSNNEMIADATGKQAPVHTTAERIKAFELVKDYLIRRPRLLNPAGSDDPASPTEIEKLRSLMQEEVEKTLNREGVVRLGPASARKKPGRKTREHLAARTYVEASEDGKPVEDDSALQAALGRFK